MSYKSATTNGNMLIFARAAWVRLPSFAGSECYLDVCPNQGASLYSPYYINGEPRNYLEFPNQLLVMVNPDVVSLLLNSVSLCVRMCRKLAMAIQLG